jgi:hypothetical protein
MKHMYKAIYGALLVLGLAGVNPVPAFAGGHFDAACNCMRPESEYNTRHEVRAPARVVNHERVVNETRVVRGNTRLIQENRLIVHVRPVINREVVVHRVNTVVRNVELHRVNTTNKFREENGGTQVVNRIVQGETRQVTERREVRGVNCNCGPESGGRGFGGQVVSFRD